MIKHAWMGVAVLLVAGHVQGQDVAQPPAKPAATLNKSEESQLAKLLADRRDPQGRRCELRAIVGGGNLYYLACGEAGVWVVRFAAGRAEIVEQRPTPGIAGGFFLRDGTLWVEATSVHAERLAPVSADAAVMSVPASLAAAAPAVGVDASAAAAGAPVPLPPPAVAGAAVAAVALPSDATPPAKAGAMGAQEFEPLEARVIAVEPGFAIIDMGSEHGVSPNDHVSFEQQTKERIGPDEDAIRRERVAVGNASTIGVTRSRVALGVGERVAVGAAAVPTRDALTSTSFAPRRLGDVWYVGFLVRPFVVIDNLGVGATLEARAGYRWEAPFHIEAVVAPAGISTGRDGAIGAGAGVITGSYDSRFFEVGLGLGAQTLNAPPFDVKIGTGTTLAQRLRVGAVDGGMIEALSYVVLFHSEFEFSDLEIHGQLPVGDRTWIMVNAGFGSLGASFGELGVRVMLTGNGDRGSFLLSATIGGTHMFRDTFCDVDEINCDDVEYTGPHAGIGAEWRL